MTPHRPRLDPLLFHWLPWLILLTGLGITYAVWQDKRDDSRQAQQDRFDFYVSELVSDIEHRLHAHEQILNGTAGLFAASASVERDEFHSYVASLRLAEDFPGARTLGFSLLLDNGSKDRHVAQVRTQGLPDYAIHPASRREVYSSVMYIEPVDRHSRLELGKDMLMDAATRQAMQNAAKSGAMTLAGMISAPRDDTAGEAADLLMFVPIHRPGGGPAASGDKRRQARQAPGLGVHLLPHEGPDARNPAPPFRRKTSGARRGNLRWRGTLGGAAAL